MLAELNWAPVASAAIAWPASCQAVLTVAVLAGRVVLAAPSAPAGGGGCARAGSSR